MRTHPQRGDVSARSALTVHRGTNAEHHDTAVTKGCCERLPQRVRDHLVCPVVDELTPTTQEHTVEGLVVGEA